MKGWVLAVVVACAACAGPPPDRETRLERLAREERALVGQLEDLQARLLVGSARVRFWEEMRERHQSVSAIACTSQDAHAAAMAHYFEQEQQKVARAPRLRQARVAALRPGAITTARQR